MAYICTKPSGSCKTCKSFRYDNERKSKVCFAAEDERKERKEFFKENPTKFVIAYDEKAIYYTGSYEDYMKIPIVNLGLKEAIYDSKIAMIMALKYNEPFKNMN